MQNLKRVSPGFFVGSVASGLLVGIVFVILGAFGSSARPRDSAPVVLFAVGCILTLYAEIVFLVLLYKAWSCIQDGSTRTTPGKAIGFLFIPIFNWFWVFRAIPGFADEYNSYLDRNNIPAKRLTRGSLQALAVLSVLSIIPILGSIAALVAMFVECGATDKLCTAINALAMATPTAFKSTAAQDSYDKDNSTAKESKLLYSEWQAKDVIARCLYISDKELLDMIDTEPSKYTPEAVEIAREEVVRRGGLEYLKDRVTDSR